MKVVHANIAPTLQSNETWDSVFPRCTSTWALMRWLKFLAGVSLLLISHAPWVSAEQFRAGPVYIDKTSGVSVVVEFESPPGGVLKDAFRLVADGKIIATAQDIKTFKDSGQGLALVLCVDVSRTMSKGKKDDPLENTKKSLLAFLRDTVRAEDRIALISFANEVKIESPFADGDTRDYLADTVGKLQTTGNQTRLYDALRKSLDILQDTLQNAKLPGVKRQTVIVISDGKDEGSTENPESVIKRSQDLGIPISAVGRGKIDKQYAESLRALSDTTGGRFDYALPAELTEKINKIYQDLLETPVIYFTYERDAAGRTIQNASIELQRPGEPSWRASLPEPIPRARIGEPPPPPPPPPRPPGTWLFWLLVVALLGLGFLILIRRRSQKGTKTPPVEEELLLPPVRPPEEGILGPQRREPTVVGGYYFPAPRERQPTAILTAVSGPLEGQQFSVEKEIFHIGVSPENELCIAEDEYVSENHASLRYEKGSLFIFDRGSKNGTFVNQNEVPDTGFVLSLGDHIRVGTSTFEVTRASS